MPDNQQFQLTFVSARKPRWSAMVFSFVVQAIALVLLIQFGVIKPREILTSVKQYHYVPIVTDNAPTAHPQPEQKVLKRAPAPRPELDRLFDSQLRIPARVPTRIPRPTPQVKDEAPQIQLAVKTPMVSLPQTPVAKPAPIVQTGTFSSGSSAVPTLKNVPARDVQTGGFGDPNGIRGIGKGDGKLVAAALGSFDLPGGPGNGNGTGGKRGKVGTIASAGFGNGVATSHPGNVVGGNASRGAIQQGGFGDSRPVEQPRPVRTVAAPVEPKTTPVRILSKPTPVYTEEARSLRLEGDVVLEVLFTANGEARVKRVVRGLGHGLDESATRAIAQIRFDPAKRDGQSVDSTSLIHVMFQLAY